MKAYAYLEVERRTVVIQVELGSNPDGSKIFALPDGRVAPVGPGQEVPTFARFPQEIADTLGIDYRGKPTKSPPSDRHLEDAIKVRDRLLALIEARAVSEMGGNMFEFVRDRS